MVIRRYFTSPAYSTHKENVVLKKLKTIEDAVEALRTELCYHVELDDTRPSFDPDEETKLRWILSNTLRPGSLNTVSKFSTVSKNQIIIECGPRFNFSTALSSNAVQMCQIIGLDNVVRLEVSCRYVIAFKQGFMSIQDVIESLSNVLYDRMTQCVYTEKNLPAHSFNESLKKEIEPWFVVPVMEQGVDALIDVNQKLGLAFDDWDIKFYYNLFKNKLRRNPTSVECFDLAQSNSEHSRHWFFKGNLIIDGIPCDKNLMEMVLETQKSSNQNNVIKFSDNSSAIEGFVHPKLTPERVNGPSKMNVLDVTSDIIFTAETHNMPTAVAPFSGATTGTGGRIRDVQAVGRGGHTIAGTAGYCVGNLRIPGFLQPWEDYNWEYPYNFSSPLEILIEASNGASDYGNKFGEPVISGFAISYGIMNSNNVREEYVKPVMFSGGIGYMSHDMVKKSTPRKGMLVVKLGGPVYRIGVGGGAASSIAVQGDNERSAALDFGAVQRGDAEMGNRLNRAIRACIESSANPIQSIHDQGAGGNGNVLKELVEPNGAVIFTKEFKLGDPTITTMELWGAEYQESNALLCLKEHKNLLIDICKRERCPVAFVGEVTDNGVVQLIEDSIDNISAYENINKNLPFNLNLESVLGKMPRKTFNLNNTKIPLKELALPPTLSVFEALQKVLRLVSVGSKRYLTNKVDRCVTGLVAQQQCVGPLHTPISNFGMIALSHFGKVGSATSIGTQPIKGILNAESGARMSVGEALTNLVFAGITCLKDIKCSSNWMWSGKTGDEGGKLAVACKAMCDLMSTLGVAVDGGKDSLSMSAGVKGSRVKSPGTLVVSTYAPVPDITIKVDPCLKHAGSVLIWVPITPGKYRLGGSALAQTLKQQGQTCPDVDDPILLKNTFNAIQKLIKGGKILSGHDISDGGFITCLLEMAIGGLRGIDVNLTLPNISSLEALFNEELGLILEVSRENLNTCIDQFKNDSITFVQIGTTKDFGMKSSIQVKFNDEIVLKSNVITIMRFWEEISYRLELLQANEECVEEEWTGLENRKGPHYVIKAEPEIKLMKASTNIQVAVIREEGSNGDREMISSLMMAGFEVYDITMHDLSSKTILLDRFKGVVFPGGFSYADTLGSAKGWAASILFNKDLSLQFNHFAFSRNDTFSLGVCNGCQLMALLGWLNPNAEPINEKTDLYSQIVLDHNKSERYECRWSCVSINTSKGSNVWFSEMEGSHLGVWVAHGEGRFSFANENTLNSLQNNNQICLQFVDDDGKPTEKYPMNPNGSPHGIAGLCSTDGRHVALMPHPERCTLQWQCPYPMQQSNRSTDDLYSPWQKMFFNAYSWASNANI